MKINGTEKWLLNINGLPGKLYYKFLGSAS
jgi:hypothetical protein